MRRSAISIPSNIAEGAARNSTKEYIRFLYINLGSLSAIQNQTSKILKKESSNKSYLTVFENYYVRRSFSPYYDFNEEPINKNLNTSLIYKLFYSKEIIIASFGIVNLIISRYLMLRDKKQFFDYLKARIKKLLTK
jgi:hypothetical protein